LAILATYVAIMATPESTRRRPLHYMREWRLARGMRQEDLAKEIGTVKSLVSRYETGETGMTFELQLRVMQALKIMPNEFFLPPPQTPDDPRRLRERQQFFKRMQFQTDGE
jgi:transcriptional regulator with XRE-family HTH domain